MGFFVRSFLDRATIAKKTKLGEGRANQLKIKAIALGLGVAIRVGVLG